MSDGVGVLRDAAGLNRAIAALLPIAQGDTAAAGPAMAGLMIAVAASRRLESRGGHARTDYPAHRIGGAVRQPLTLTQALDTAETIGAAA